MKTIFTIKGTHCHSCKALIEDIASEIVGIKSCTIDFQTGKTEVEHDENTDWKKFKDEVEKAGDYQVEGI